MISRPESQTPVRVATADDAAEIIRLGGLMYMSMGIAPTVQWEADSVCRIKARMGGDLLGWVIEGDEDDELAATALVNIWQRLPRPGISGDDSAYVQWVSTDPRYRRRGYARALMAALMDDCGTRGIEVVELHASPYGEPLYADLGYRSDNIGVAMRSVRPTKRL